MSARGCCCPAGATATRGCIPTRTWRRLEFILNLARDLGVNIAGIAIVLQMRERMEEMNRQMQGFVDYVRTEMLSRIQQQQPSAGLVPMPGRRLCHRERRRGRLWLCRGRPRLYQKRPRR